MRTGLTFEIEKAKLPLMEKDKVALGGPPGWNPSMGETRGDCHSRRYMENLHVSPPAMESKNKKSWIFPQRPHGPSVITSTTSPTSQPDRGQPWSYGSWGWHRSQRDPQEVQARPTQRGPPLPLHHPQHHHPHPHRASPSTCPMPQGRNGCRPVIYFPPSPTSPPLPKWSTKIPKSSYPEKQLANGNF